MKKRYKFIGEEDVFDNWISSDVDTNLLEISKQVFVDEEGVQQIKDADHDQEVNLES